VYVVCRVYTIARANEDVIKQFTPPSKKIILREKLKLSL
jgi:hypothetical protein